MFRSQFGQKRQADRSNDSLGMPDRSRPFLPRRSPRWAIATLAFILTSVLLGVVLRGVNLEEKFYWVDEVHTTVRVAGYTRDEVEAQIFDQGILFASQLQDYQTPTVERSWGETLNALKQHPEHAPLYYILGRAWIHAVAIAQGTTTIDSVTALRMLSVVFGVLLLPAIYLLGRAGFGANPVGEKTAILAIAIVALSPLHILYAQEARQYSLWTLATALATAALWHVLQHNLWRNWLLYGATLILGLYSHLLFGTVAIAHGLYILIARPSRSVMLRYGTVLAASLIAFLPWLVALGQYLTQVERAVDATQRNADLNYLFNVWLRNLSRIFFSADLGAANLVVAGLALYALWLLCRQTPAHTWIPIVSLIVVSAAPLMIADSFTGGISSTRIRYLIPAYIGIQVAIAHMFAKGLSSPQRRSRRLWTAGTAVFLLGMMVASVIDSGQAVNWTKSDKAAYYPAIAQSINEGDRPLVISDSSPTYVLALSRLVKEDVQVQLVTRPNALDLENSPTNPFGDIFVFDPSKRLQRILSERHGYTLQVVVEQNESFQLLQATPSSQAYADPPSPQLSNRAYPHFAGCATDFLVQPQHSFCPDLQFDGASRSV